MKLRILSVAEAEQVETATYYEADRAELGREFVDEFERTLGRILQHPMAWSPISERVRGCRMKRFPFSVIYHIGLQEILVIALQHHKREPRRWEDRMADIDKEPTGFQKES
jgi:plasmid stabilization system protein ParE